MAYLPAFLGRGPDHRLHRAVKAAFARGFAYEQSVRDFGFNDDEWSKFRSLYETLDAQRPKDKSIEGQGVFYDWEIQELKKIFERFKNSDPEVCAVLSHMMWYVSDRDHFSKTAR